MHDSGLSKIAQNIVVNILKQMKTSRNDTRTAKKLEGKNADERNLKRARGSETRKQGKSTRWACWPKHEAW